MRNKRSLCLALLAQLRSYRSMPTEKQLLEQAKQLQGQTSATDEAPVTIFAALLLADTIRAAGSCAPRCGSRIATLTMVFKLGIEAQKHWRRPNGKALLPKVVTGVQFIDGEELQEQAA